jgi:hypothetical protein
MLSTGVAICTGVALVLNGLGENGGLRKILIVQGITESLQDRCQVQHG